MYICICINNRPTDVITLSFAKNMKPKEVNAIINRKVLSFVNEEVSNIKSFEQINSNNVKVTDTTGREYHVSWDDVELWTKEATDELLN